MATNKILPFADTAAAGDMLTDAQYAADARRNSGHVRGIASRVLANKSTKQVAAVAAGVGQFVADNQTEDVTDADTPVGLAAKIKAALLAIVNPLLELKLDKTGGSVSGPLRMATGADKGYMFDVDTGVVSNSDGSLRLQGDGVVRVVVSPTDVQFLNAAGTVLAKVDNNGLRVTSTGGSSNIYMGSAGFLTLKDDGTQAGFSMGAGNGWSALFAKTPVAGASANDVVTAEWIRRFVNAPVAGVIDIGDVRLMRGAFVAADILTWPQETTGSITFPASFGAEPTVVLGAYGDARLAFVSISGSPRTNGFDWRGQEPSGTTYQQNYICSYFAMGPKP